MTTNEVLYKYVLHVGDNAMILGHRLSELCGHGPSLETDIALTNISLDFFGQVRSYFQYAAQLKGEGLNEDKIAYFRNEREFHNVILVEQPNTDFAYVIGRQFLFDAFHLPFLEALQSSNDDQLSAIASKSIKEARYHLAFSSEWVKRLGNGTDESKMRMQNAINDLYPFTEELFVPSEIETQALSNGFGVDLERIKPVYQDKVSSIIESAELKFPEGAPRFAKGKKGYHSEHLGPLLSVFQSTQRAYPDLEW